MFLRGRPERLVPKGQEVFKGPRERTVLLDRRGLPDHRESQDRKDAPRRNKTGGSDGRLRCFSLSLTRSEKLLCVRWGATSSRRKRHRSFVESR